LTGLLCAAVATGALLAGGAACTSSADAGSRADSFPKSSASQLRRDDPYAMAVRVAMQHGLKVWIEADLASRWLEGSASFRAALDRVIQLARIPGVQGVKIADELGYDDGFAGRPGRMRAFVAAAAATLHPQLPGRRLLIDLVVPQLGCLPGNDSTVAVNCRQSAAVLHPGLSLADIDALLGTGAIDVVDLSTGLLTARQYLTMRSSPDAAQASAWREAMRRGWARHAVLQARKALAHPGVLSGQAGSVSAELHTYIDIPLQKGARAVDIWTWHQAYHGQIYRLTDPHGRPNALWTALGRRRAAGDALFTHFSPSNIEVSVDSDLAEIATTFSSVFIAAGTG
jgi:hypothetical protein